MKIKSEPLALLQDKDSHMYPTIPCALYFLLHLQQLEIGGFTLANGMYKWQKMRYMYKKGFVTSTDKGVQYIDYQTTTVFYAFLIIGRLDKPHISLLRKKEYMRFMQAIYV
jgi:hypothetical protein